jgi:RNA polymerase sigma factor (sigma-70 family)
VIVAEGQERRLSVYCYDEEVTPKLFDSFCKKLLRNEARDCYREIKRKESHEVLVPDYKGIEPAEVDDYEFFMHTFDIHGVAVHVSSDNLADALRSLKKCDMEIVILYNCLGLNDREIGEKLGILRSTIRYKRVHAIGKLREELL